MSQTNLNRIVRTGAERFITTYKNAILQEGGTPHTSQDVLNGLLNHGIAYATGVYVRHCLERGQEQAHFMTKKALLEKVLTPACAALFAAAGPAETVASILTSPQKVTRFERNIPLVDWIGGPNDSEEQNNKNSNNQSNSQQGRHMSQQEWNARKADIARHNDKVIREMALRKEFEEATRLPDPQKHPYKYLKARELALSRYCDWTSVMCSRDVDPNAELGRVQDLLRQKGKDVTYDDLIFGVVTFGSGK